jgi:hypothetical protein
MMTATAKKQKVDDVWNIRKPAKPFTYSGRQADIILFLQPKLLNRGLKYSNQNYPMANDHGQ